MNCVLERVSIESEHFTESSNPENKFVYFFGHQASVSSGDVCWFNGDVLCDGVVSG